MLFGKLIMSSALLSQVAGQANQMFDSLLSYLLINYFTSSSSAQQDWLSINGTNNVHQMSRSAHESLLYSFNHLNNNNINNNNNRTEEIILVRGVTLTLDITFLLVPLIIAIAIPILYEMFVVRQVLDKIQKKFKRKTRTRSTYYDKFGKYQDSIEAFALQDMEKEENARSTLFWKLVCFCGWRNFKNFFFTTPLGADNSLAAINENGSFAMYHSTPFQLLDRMGSTCCTTVSTSSSEDLTPLFPLENNVKIKSVTSKSVHQYNISCWISSSILLLIRIANFVLAVVTAAYIGKDEIFKPGKHNPWFEYTKYLTNNTFNLFLLYSSLVMVYHIILMMIAGVLVVKKRKPTSGNTDTVTFPYADIMPRNLEKCLDVVGNLLWFLSEMNLVTSSLVSIGFWTIIVPTGNFPSEKINFIIISSHGLVFIGSFIETLMSDFYLKFWHIFIIGLFSPIYLLYIIGLKESGLISSLPYGNLLDYDQGDLAIAGHFTLTIGLYLLFALFWLVFTVFKKLTVVKFCDSYAFPSTFGHRSSIPHNLSSGSLERRTSNSTTPYYQASFKVGGGSGSSERLQSSSPVSHTRSISLSSNGYGVEEEEQFTALPVNSSIVVQTPTHHQRTFSYGTISQQ